MSWRISTDMDSNRDGAADFTIGVDGTAEECVEQSWNQSPIKVRFSNVDSLRQFLDVWCQHRSTEDVWQFYRKVDGFKDQYGPDHPKREQLEAELVWIGLETP